MGMATPALPRSEARKTPTTPGARRAADTSMERMRACACGERSITACRQPGTRKSSTNSPALRLVGSVSARRTLALALSREARAPVEGARDERAQREDDEDDAHAQQDERDRSRDEDGVAPRRHGEGLTERELHHGREDEA